MDKIVSILIKLVLILYCIENITSSAVTTHLEDIFINYYY